MGWTRIAGRAGALSGSIAVLALLAGGASQAQAAECDRDIAGGGPISLWEVADADGEFEDATLYTFVGSDVERDDAFDDYGEVNIDGSDYQNPDTAGCSFPSKREALYPADELGGLFVRPQLFVDKKKPWGRHYVSLRNPTNAPITVDFEWDGDLGSDSGAANARTSSGDAVVNGADRWATTCEDGDTDGCANVADEADRDPELAHNWEGKGRKKHSADTVVDPEDTSGDFDVEFDDVRVGAGKTIAFMQIVSLTPTIKAANKIAPKIDRNPAKYGVFRALSKKERKRLQNW